MRMQINYSEISDVETHIYIYNKKTVNIEN